MKYRVELTKITDENDLPVVVEVEVKDRYAKRFEELVDDDDLIGIGHVSGVDNDFEV